MALTFQGKALRMDGTGSAVPVTVAGFAPAVIFGGISRYVNLDSVYRSMSSPLRNTISR
jgi:hypothetical protein